MDEPDIQPPFAVLSIQVINYAIVVTVLIFLFGNRYSIAWPTIAGLILLTYRTNFYIIIDRVSGVGKAIGRVRMFPLCLLKQLTDAA